MFVIKQIHGFFMFKFGEKKKGTGDYMNKNQNIRFNIEMESNIKVCRVFIAMR